MALSLKVTGHARSTEEVLLELAPPWWNAGKLRSDRRFINAGESGHYLDYDTYLSIEEMREIHERYRSAATEGIYANRTWQAIIQPMIKVLDEALYTSFDQYGYFHIRVFEWESGLE